MTLDKGVVVSPVAGRQDLEAVKLLFRAYADWLDIDLSYQNFEDEIAAMPGKYAPPHGALFMAKDMDGRILGCVGLRPIAPDDTCEMKRLYVLPEGRGLGIGAALVECVLDAATAAGYKAMVLDTLPMMTGAIRLYRSAGFEETEAYYDTPVPETLFFRKSL